MKKVLPLIASLLLVFLSCKTTTSVTAPALNKAVTVKMQELITTNKLPGLNFSVIYPNGQQADYTAGMANVVSF